MACEYLSLGLHMGSDSGLAPLNRILVCFFLNVFHIAGWVGRAWAWFPTQISFHFSPVGFFQQVFSLLPSSNHDVLLVVAQLSLFIELYYTIMGIIGGT